jgi:tryptophan synthase alpha chain
LNGIERISEAFERRRGRAALMPYLMGGFPDRETSLAIGRAYADAGADLVELGVPFSDPLADGPVIQEAGARALEAGATPESVLETAAALSDAVPVVLMTYSNLVLSRGADEFVSDLAAAGVSGLIVPDLPLEESGELGDACEASGIALVPLAAPTSSDDRMEQIGSQARGFLYTVSVSGTTGERSGDAGYAELIERARGHSRVPVALGFGISTPEQADAAAQAGADGVIVGSRLVREASESDDPASACGALVERFAQALR